MLAAVHMLLHDINSPDCENKEALAGARRSVAQFRSLSPLVSAQPQNQLLTRAVVDVCQPFVEVDSFAVLVWSMIARCLVKEAHRLSKVDDAAGGSRTVRFFHCRARVLLAYRCQVGLG